MINLWRALGIMKTAQLIILLAFCNALILWPGTAAKTKEFATDCNVTNCVKCEVDKAICDPGGCRTNYGLHNNTCTECIFRCEQCDDHLLKCDKGKCHKDYVQMSSDTTCVKDCPVIGFAQVNNTCEACQVEHCNQCMDGPTLCDIAGCDRGYTTSGKHDLCLECHVPNCLYCNHERIECEQGGCQLGFGVSKELESCEPCIPFCLKCDTDPMSCVENEYYYDCNASSLLAGTCPMRCASTRFFFDNVTRACKPCPAYCSQCSQSELKCDEGKCDEDYEIDKEGKCIAGTKYWMMVTWIMLGLFGLTLILIACGVACYYMFDSSRPVPVLPRHGRPYPEPDYGTQQVVESSKGGKKTAIDVERNLHGNFVKGFNSQSDNQITDNESLSKVDDPDSGDFVAADDNDVNAAATASGVDAALSDTGAASDAVGGVKGMAGHERPDTARKAYTKRHSAGTRSKFVKGGKHPSPKSHALSPHSYRGSTAFGHGHTGEHAKGLKR